MFLRIQEYMTARRKRRQRQRWEKAFNRDSGVRIYPGGVYFFGAELKRAAFDVLGGTRGDVFTIGSIDHDGVKGYYTVADEGLTPKSDRGCLMIHAHSDIDWGNPVAMGEWAGGVVREARAVAWRNYLERLETDRLIAAANAAANSVTGTEVAP